MSKRPGKMTRKQHWVPQFYPRHFADSSGRLHVYGRQKGSVLEMIVRHFKYNAPSLEAHLVTAPDGYSDLKQVNYPERLRESMAPLGVDFTWDIDRSRTLHTRHLKVEDRWGILLDRDLDIWKRFDNNDAFSIEARMSEKRRMKAFVITYMRVELWRPVERSTRTTHSICN